MTAAEIRHLKQWFEKAEHDLIAADLIIRTQPIILDIACFHCQQAVEKYLKTFLVFNNQDFPKTHNLDILLKNCSELNAAFSSLDFGNLEDFAVRGRYPHDFISPDAVETQSFYQIAQEVKALVLKHVIVP